MALVCNTVVKAEPVRNRLAFEKDSAGGNGRMAEATLVDKTNL
jgi:hypothetical protein